MDRDAIRGDTRAGDGSYQRAVSGPIRRVLPRFQYRHRAEPELAFSVYGRASGYYAFTASTPLSESSLLQDQLAGGIQTWPILHGSRYRINMINIYELGILDI